MEEVAAIAEENILAGSDISRSDLENTLSDMMGNQIDYGEVYLQSVRSESWGLEDGIVKDGSFSVDAGIGVYAAVDVQGVQADGCKTD